MSNFRYNGFNEHELVNAYDDFYDATHGLTQRCVIPQHKIGLFRSAIQYKTGGSVEVEVTPKTNLVVAWYLPLNVPELVVGE